MLITPFGLNETTQKIKDEIRRLDNSVESVNNAIGSDEAERIEEDINELLKESNIIEKISDTSPNSKLSSYLTQAGGSLEKVAENIVGIMNRGDTDSGRLKAAEFISKMHGVQIQLEETSKNNNEKPPIVINVAGVDSKTMINFFMPKS